MKNRKNVLIVINSLELGGAQKSLISFLSCLEKQGSDRAYDIDLIVAKPKGIFMDQIPSFVNQLSPIPELLWLGTPRGDELLGKYPSSKGQLGKLEWIITCKQKLFSNRLNEEQRIWKNWKHLIPVSAKHYDIAVAYMNGFPGYYVIDKVIAERKVLWIHNEYQKLQYDYNYDRPYYTAADKIITISDTCLQSFTEIFPDLKSKISVLQNITIEEDVRAKGLAGEAPEFESCNCTKVLSVGRLAEQKQFDLAIHAAEVLVKRKFPFLWLIIGDGPDRDSLSTMITEKHLEKCVKLIGPKKNPYAYMARCDLFVQTSRFEGKSIVLDEAKVFRKPLIVTDYPTAKDTITDGENGVICRMDLEAIADAILRVSGDEALRKRFEDALSADAGNEAELQKYIQLMFRG